MTVERKLHIGPRDVTWAAMQAGTDINIMPEYIGSLLETINDHAGEASGDADATSARHSRHGSRRWTMSVLAQTPGVDTNAFVVTADDGRSSTRSPA